MKFITKALRGNKEDGIRNEISYVDMSAIESELEHYVPKSRKRVNFDHHKDLDFDKIVQDQKRLKELFESHEGNFAEGRQAEFNDSRKFEDFKNDLVSFFRLFDLDPKISDSGRENQHHVIMISNHQGFEGKDILSLSKEDLMMALKAPYVMENSGNEDFNDTAFGGGDTDLEPHQITLGKVGDDEETDVESDSSISSVRGALKSGDISNIDVHSSDIDPRIGCYLLDMVNLNKKLDEIIKARPSSKDEIDMFRSLIDKARDKALDVAQKIQEQKVLEEQMEQKQQEIRVMREAMLIEEEEEKNRFEEECKELGVEGLVDKIVIGPMTQAVLDSRSAGQTKSVGMSR